MWVFDGEEWKEEGGQRRDHPSDASVQQWDPTMPELQVVEYVPTPVRHPDYMPPLPSL